MPAQAQAAWETSPDPAPIPQANADRTAHVNVTGIYYEVQATSGPRIVFLHSVVGSALASPRMPAILALARGKRSIRGGRADVRRAFYIAAFIA